LFALISHSVITFALSLSLVSFTDDSFSTFSLAWSRTQLLGLPFTNCIGIAAGFDKNGEAIDALFRMGFGFVEIGSVTPLPQPGNPRPRVFRLPVDRAVINRYGFNSHGSAVVAERLKSWRESHYQSCSCEPSVTSILNTSRQILGVNLGKNKETAEASIDYVKGVDILGSYADYLVVNVSSPNTPNLRSLQEGDTLEDLIKVTLLSHIYLSLFYSISSLESWHSIIFSFCIPFLLRKSFLTVIIFTHIFTHIFFQKVMEARDRLRSSPSSTSSTPSCWFCRRKAGVPPPLFVKIAPDLSLQQKAHIADVALRTGLDGLIVCNTTVGRSPDLKSRATNDAKVVDEIGGLSGAPLRDIATQCIGEVGSSSLTPIHSSHLFSLSSTFSFFTLLALLC
jgi:dihydroorotate dehydrogenase